MHSSATDFRWGLGRRLEFIEFRLFWEGGVNRSDIVTAFGVSVPQASKDLALYQEQAPSNIQYDRSLKRYFGSSNFRPKFIKNDSADYLEQLNARTISGVGADSWVSSNPTAEKLPLPQRRVLPDVLRTLLECIRGEKSIEVLYQSMSASRPDPKWRRISVSAGFAQTNERRGPLEGCRAPEDPAAINQPSLRIAPCSVLLSLLHRVSVPLRLPLGSPKIRLSA
jgi:hypothetical protein